MDVNEFQIMGNQDTNCEFRRRVCSSWLLWYGRSLELGKSGVEEVFL